MKAAIAIGIVLLLALVACETRSTTVVNDDEDFERVAVVDTDPDVTVVQDRDPVVVERVWWRPSTWSRTTTTTNSVNTVNTESQDTETTTETDSDTDTGTSTTTQTTTETTA